MPERREATATQKKKVNQNQMRKLIHILAVIVLGLRLAFERSRGFVAAANTYDAAVETHPCTVKRTNDAAITARHLLWKKGASDGTIALNGATDIPLGTIDNTESSTGLAQTVYLLGKGDTKKMVASEAIGAGVRVYAAASGKVATTGTIPVGISLTAAGTDDDILEVADGIAAATPSGTSHKIIAAGIHPWAGGAATTDSISVVGLEATDVVHCTLVARASTETLVLTTNDAGNDQIDLTLSANGTDTTTKISYSVLRAA